MDVLFNAFSLLELDAEDDDQARRHTASTSTGKTTLKDDNRINDGKRRNQTKNKETLTTSSDGYKLPLVWIDLVMTGLDVSVDRILEIACIITDGSLNNSVEGPDIVVHQTQECLDRMGEWCQTHNTANGLTTKVIQSTITEHEAEMQVIEFIKEHVGTYTPLLTGNTIYNDYMFLKKYMPKLASMFPHVLVDVSSVKALCRCWYPQEGRDRPQKEKHHRVMDDIRESIMELKYYKEHIFKSKSKK